ncbi:hypothetical protein [Magnetospirillum sp. SS-4]|uniref:hypothetical protein n=1 Tax=Magnetospirillum sp. SS-4 TaxID=2681465 RepID=UPI0013823696|nr:hypothetical protein [Magnetospirillum sp. SS-4]CAA7627624.1 hypothetical protein MTBSS4_90149 [Magnetospirillum sp. SS-4]
MEKSKLIKFAAAGTAILVLAGYFGLQHWADDKADREIKRTLIGLDLDRVIRYGSVNASILGRSVTLSDVTLTSPDGRGPSVTVKNAKISDLDTYRDQLSAARIKLAGISIPMLEIAQAQRKGSSDGNLERFIGMGYSVVTGESELYFRLAPDKQRGEVAISADLDDLGGASFTLALDRVDQRLADFGRQTRDAVMAQNPMLLLRDAPVMVDNLARLELADLSVGIKDRGLRKRLLTEAAEDALVTEDADRLATTMGAELTKSIREQLDRQRVDPRLSSDVASKIGAYVESGGELKLTTRIDRPIPLFDRGGFLGIQPAPFLMSLDRFFTLTGARLER